MREIKQIVVHGAWTTPDQDFGIEDYREWHLAKGWSDVGYHFGIRRDGTLEIGRPIEQAGAHTLGFNKTSLGIVMTGGRTADGSAWEFNYTAAQMAALASLVNTLKMFYPDAEIGGHRHYDDRECPGFNVIAWASTL